MDTPYHIPALLQETLDGLCVKPDGVYADLTFGGGGHSRAILERLGQNGRLYSFDQDIEALANGERLKAQYGERWQFVHGNFRYLKNFLNYYGVTQVDGILADLGVSFHHFDTAERGFSFRYPGPLDMRMNRQSKLTAAKVLNEYDEDALSRILSLYGELNNARQLTRKIVKCREQAPIERTEQLVEIVLGKKVKIAEDELEIDSKDKKDLARLFQALRIEVNDEMVALREMLQSSLRLLAPQGRIAILTYHSLEDRLVKNFFRSGNLEGKIEKDFYGNVLTPFSCVGKPVTAGVEEVEQNPRARSAKLRIAIRKQS